MDALSELLRTAKLSGAMFFAAHCGAPWCVRSPPSSEFNRHVGSPSSRVIEFHLVATGRGYVRVGAETTPIEAGDIIMMPHGDPHVMGNGLAPDVVDDAGNLSDLLSGRIKISRLGGDGDQTRLLCGYLACEARLIEPLLAGLPRVVRVHIRSDAYGELLEGMVHHAVAQLAADAPGSGVIAARVAEVLFAEVLRRYLLNLPAGRTGWLAAVGDPVVGRALAAIHREPSRDWTLDGLADEAGVGRSALNERFRRALGHAPMAYLSDWRLELAAEALRSSSRGVLAIAGDVGYESEAAFNRAFKRRFGEPPARYRRTWRETLREAAPGDGTAVRCLAEPIAARGSD